MPFVQLFAFSYSIVEVFDFCAGWCLVKNEEKIQPIAILVCEGQNQGNGSPANKGGKDLVHVVGNGLGHFWHENLEQRDVEKGAASNPLKEK